MILNKYKYKIFGRFKGRKKLPSIDINKFLQFKFDTKKNINFKSFNILDIGSGSGENAIFLSNKNPNFRITTCELFHDGNINLFNKIIEKKISNINLYEGNVLEFLDSLVFLDDTKLFNEIWILFPDPWPKKRHNKRRLINCTFLNKISLYLKDNGKLMIASDSSPYIGSILNSIHNSQSVFKWQNQRYEEWNYENLDLPETKFYKKALKSNRNSMIFTLHKI